MSFLDEHILSWLTFVPSIGALFILFFGRNQSAARIRSIALVTSLLALALALRVIAIFEPEQNGLQLVHRFSWIPAIHVDYFVGVDGISVLLLLLAALVVPLSILASTFVDQNAHAKTYFFLVLLMQTGIFGVFTAMNFFHWFIYWELVLIPAFFLIKMWGGTRAHRAALKFLLYTLVGSVAMLLGFQAIYLATGSFDFIELARLGQSGELTYKLYRLAESASLDWEPSTCAVVVFLFVLLAFAVKTPMWPFHTWLPDTYAEAPTATTILLTAALSKMGVYGILRILVPLFPQLSTAASDLLLLLAVVTVVAGAFAALAQTDLKRMAAYSSINHVGYCLVGVFAALSRDASPVLANDRAAALNGVVLQMFNHGITAAAFFFLLGALERRTLLRGIDDFGGLRAIAPRFMLLFGIALFSSLGLPGLNGFVSELLILKGAFALNAPLAAVSLVGVVVTAVFLLLIMQRVWWGPLKDKWAAMPDLSARELVGAGAFALIMIGVGVYPRPFVAFSNSTVNALVGVIERALPAESSSSSPSRSSPSRSSEPTP